MEFLVSRLGRAVSPGSIFTPYGKEGGVCPEDDTVTADEGAGTVTGPDGVLGVGGLTEAAQGVAPSGD